MSMNNTPSGERVHIGFFGRRNAGKSSVVNAVTGQDLAVVSDVKGTTTDPVSKAMELLPLGPVMINDTPGFDDEGHLGELRIRKTRQVLNKTDIAILVVDATEGQKECDRELIGLFRDDPDVIFCGALALQFQCVTLCFQSWIIMSNMMLQTIGRTVPATFLAMARQGIFFIPLVWVLAHFLGITGIQMTQMVSDILTLSCCVPIQLKVLKELSDPKA